MTDDIVTRLRARLMADGFANPEDTSDAADEIERLRAEKSGILAVGNSLLNLSEADSKCQCRREWVCHRCQAIDAWKSVCND
jgi:hypothetical protein